MSAFVVDKQRSLEIIRSIMKSQPILEDSDGEKKIYKHKLDIARVFLSDPAECETYYDPNLDRQRIVGIDQYSDLSDHYPFFIEETQKGPEDGYDLCENPEIAELSIKEDKIILNDVYISKDDSDWSTCSFTYDETLKTWIETGEEAKGIDYRGCVTVLVFRELHQ